MLNRKKIIAALIFLGLSGTMLYGCTVNVYNGKGTETVEDNDSEEKEDDEVLAEAEEEVNEDGESAAIPKLESVDFDLTEYDEDKNKVFESYGNSYLCTADCEGDFPDLAKALKDIDQNEKDAYSATIDEYKEDAAEFAGQQREDGEDYTYYSYNETELKTADDKVVSLLRTEYGYLGGAHPDYYYAAFNIDVKTGKDIILADIVTDKEGLDAILIDKLNEKYPDGDFFDLEESLKSYYIDDASDEENAAAYTFTMGPDGISFYFGPYDLNSYADGAQQIDLTYGDLEGILKDDYIYAGIEEDKKDEISADSRFEEGSGEYIDLYLEKASELDKAGKADQFALIDIDGDGIKELAASSSEGAWDKDQVFLFTVKDDEIVLLTSDIATGMEGHYIGCFEGQNVIDCSGAAAGERHNYYEIKDGELNLLLSLAYFDDPEKDYETVYFVDEKETDEDEYNKKGKKFFEKLEDMTVFETKEMKEYTVKWADGYTELTESDTVPYMSLEELQEAFEE